MSFANIASNAKAVVETSLFAKNLNTLVKGVRALKDKEQAQYIAKALAEIKTEISGNDFELKTEALRKLIFLQMLGYDMSWASFHIIEIMSQPWFGYRRIAYLAAALCFTQDTPVTLLATNLLKQTFQNSGGANEYKFYDVGTAISCLAGIVTPTLAEHLLLDIYNLMNSNSAYLRKKSTLALFRIFLCYPKALKFSFDRLKEKLGDENQGVVAAAIYVLCELAARNPKNYLAMAPQFYAILTSSSNNWVLIKVVKLLGTLVPLEPRLAKKLQEPLMEIISTTGAKSLMYECVNTLLSGELTSKAAVRLCLEKLTIFVEDPDQNLKYLGLLGLHKLMTTFPRLVTEHKDLILNCLEDEDETIRIRALDLVSHMVTPKTLPTVIRKLVDHLQSSKGSYRDVVLEHILRMCCNDTFGTVVDFEWLVIVLLDLTRLRGASLKNAILLRDAFAELLVVVPDLRPFAVGQFTQVVLSGRLCRDADAMSEVLCGIVFAIGEYAQYTHSHLQLIRALLSPSIGLLSPTVQTACVHAATKVFVASLSQPYFKTASDAVEWEQKQLEKAKKQNARADDIKANTQQDDEEDEYEDEEDEEEDEDEEDEEEEEKKKNKKRRAKRQEIFSVGHTTFVGRTLDQHVLFIEEIVCHLLARFAYFGRSAHAEVQERAQCYRTFLSLLLQENSKLRIPKQLLQGAVSYLKDSASNDEVISENIVNNTNKEASEEHAKPLEPKKEEKPFDIFELFNTDVFDPLNALASASASDSNKTTLTDTYNLANSNHVDSILALLNAAEPAAATASPTSETKESEEIPVSLESDERIQSLNKLRIQLAFFTAEELLPPGLKSQRKVDVPDGLDLDDIICDEPDSDDEREKEDERKRKIKEKEREEAYEARYAQSTGGTTSTSSLVSSKNKSLDEKARKEIASSHRNTDSPFYLGASTTSSKRVEQSKISSRTDDILADLDLSDVGMKKKKKDEDEIRKMNVIRASKPSDKEKKKDEDEEFEGEVYTKDAGNKKTKKTKEEESPKTELQAPQSPSQVSGTFTPSISHSIVYHDEYVTFFLQAKSTSTQPPADGIYNAYISLTACGTPSAELIQIPALQCTIHPNKKSYCELQQSLAPQGTCPSQVIENPNEKGSIIFQAKKLGTSNTQYATAAYQVYSKALSPKTLTYNADLNYRIKNGEQTSTVTKSITLHIPISSFVVPVQKSSQEVVALLSDSDSNLEHLSTLKLTSADIPKLIRSISTVLRVALIETSNVTTLYYGKYIGAPEGYEHICIYAKVVDDGSVLKVDIKTCSQQLSDSLLDDLQRLA